MSELHDKGEQIYNTQILPQLPIDKLKGKIIAIEIKSADYFIENTVLKAVMLGRKRYPQQKFYCKLLGYRAVYSYPSYVPIQVEENK
ncbi:MAG: hypothetical protein DRQ49_16745 [Gammaproteobacteria bacterium]|nr:MAG: hypothetical protein DRQ49_16745 [Gammaproteobacteria bacterium]